MIDSLFFQTLLFSVNHKSSKAIGSLSHDDHGLRVKEKSNQSVNLVFLNYSTQGIKDPFVSHRTKLVIWKRKNTRDSSVLHVFLVRNGELKPVL